MDRRNRRSRTRAVISLAVALALALPPRISAADDPTPEQIEQARAHFQQGVKLAGETDFRAAIIEFQRAYDIAPNWSILFNIAQCHYELLEYAGALATFERYLAEGGTQVPLERREKVEKEIAELKGRVGRITIETNVAGVEIVIDEQSVGKTPLLEPAIVSAGRRKITASKDGYVTVTKLVDVAGNDALDIRLVLTAASRKDDGSVVAPRMVPRSSTLTYLGFSLAGAGLAVGSVFGLIALNDRSDLDAECPSKKCGPSSQKKIDALSRDATISTIGFGAALVGLGLGV
jgi:hypothetical protein